MSSPPPNDGLTFAPNREGLTIDGWRNGTRPDAGRPGASFHTHDIARSLAIAPDAKRFFLGSSYALAAFDDAGAQKWRWQSRNEVWAVNASKDGRVVVSADGDGAIRWHRADDGRELLALQVLPNKKRTGQMGLGAVDARRLLRGDARRRGRAEMGDQSRAGQAPRRRFPSRPSPSCIDRTRCPIVLDQLETAHALGVDDISQARLDVQAATGSAKPPGGVLHVLAIGVDKFGDKAGGLHLDYAAEDAHDVASRAAREPERLRPARRASTPTSA